MIAAQTTDRDARQVEQLLQSSFDDASCYRYNSVSLRARVRDRKFTGIAQSQREEMVEPILDRLPTDLRDQLLLLLLLPENGPETLSEQLLNQEFENPTPTRL
jgi:hypothetical protein